MQVELTSSNHSQKHRFNIVVRKGELVLATPDGDEIASIKVETMETDSLGKDGKYYTVPTENFYVTFCPTENIIGKDVAHAWIKRDETPEPAPRS